MPICLLFAITSLLILGGEGGRFGAAEESVASQTENIFFVPTPHPVKSSVLGWCPVLSRFCPRVQQWNKIFEKIEDCEQATGVMML